MTMSTKCKKCKGTGKTREGKCGTCLGSGQVVVTEKGGRLIVTPVVE